MSQPFLYLLHRYTKNRREIRLIQTDNGTEFTNALLVTKAKHKTMFEQALLDMGIEYQRASNNHIMTCLHMRSPNQVLARYQAAMW